MSTSGFNYEVWGDRALPEEHLKHLDELWPSNDRLALCWRLAKNIDDLSALIAGYYVDPARLDQDWLRWAKRQKFVALKPALSCVAPAIENLNA